MPAHPHRTDAADSAADAAFARYRASGSPADLAAVFDATALGLSVLAGHLARRSGDAEDFVQQTFLVAMRDARTWDGERPVAAWLAGILRHRALELNRRRERSRNVGDAPLDDLVTREPSPLDHAAEAEAAERIAAAIARIDGPSQQVLVLRLVHGLEPTAIAHALGRPPGTVRMQLARGLERLRELLPASLAAVLASLALETRGLAAVRAAVLAATPAASVATTAATPLVALVVMKKWILAAALLIAAVVAVLSITSNDTPRLEGATDGGAVVRTTSDDLATTPERELATTDNATSRTTLVADATETPAAPVASLTVSVVSSDDGSPRPNIGVVASRVGGGALLRVVTDEAGEAHFAEGIANGEYEVGLDRRRGSRHVEVDGSTRFTYEAEIGVDIRGRVVDFHGAPVADARVCYIDDDRRANLCEIARTDADGRFTAAWVQSYERIVARMSGHQISPPELVRDGTEEIVLTLGARGHTLRGRVLDTSGAPVPFARVVVGSEQRARRSWDGASTPPQTPPETASVLLEGTQTVADEHGRYELDDVPAGPVVVIARPHARQSELAGWAHGFVEFEGALDIDVTLAPGARIVGTLTDAQGRPLAGLRVQATLQRSLELGSFFGDVLFASVLDNTSVRSADDGSFALVGLLPGIQGIDVLPDTVPRDSLLYEELRVRPGETVRFDRSLERGVDQPIRVVGPGGAPLEGWLVEVVNSNELGLGWVAVFHTNADGRVVIRGLAADVPFEIRVLPPESGSASRRCELVASNTEFLVDVGAHELPSSRVVARVTEPPPGLELALINPGEQGMIGRATAFIDPQGTFCFEGVVPGEYRIETAGAGHPVGDVLAQFVVAPNTVHEVGPLAVPQHGRIALALECDDGAPASIAQVVMRSAGGHEITDFEHTDSGFTSPPLLPGTYTLNIVPADAAPFDATIEVDARALQPHRLVCARGARVRALIAPFKSGTTMPLSVEMIVGRPEGGHLFSRTFTRPADAAHFEFDFHLAPGTYHCWAWEPDGPQRPPFDGELVVPAEGVELRVVLD